MAVVRRRPAGALIESVLGVKFLKEENPAIGEVVIRGVRARTAAPVIYLEVGLKVLFRTSHHRMQLVTQD